MGLTILLHYQGASGVLRPAVSLNTDPARTFVAGLSMGGYGALKCAFTYPPIRKSRFVIRCNRYSARIHDMDMPPGMLKEMQAVFGPELEIQPSQDLYALARQRLEETGKLPPILSRNRGSLYRNEQGIRAICGKPEPTFTM